jgi:hypothetical protein
LKLSNRVVLCGAALPEDAGLALWRPRHSPWFLAIQLELIRFIGGDVRLPRTTGKPSRGRRCILPSGTLALREPTLNSLHE